MVRVSARPEKLRAILAEKNISQRRLAQMAGFAPAYISQLISGTRRTSANGREKLLSAINKIQRAKGQHEYTFDDLFIIGR